MSFLGKKVSKEMNRMMDLTSNLHYDLSNRSLMSSAHAPIQITRKPKRKSKLRIAEEIHRVSKRCFSTAFFQKRSLFLTTYMGLNSPKSFSCCDKNICLTGLLSSISLEASKKMVQNEICAVIHSSCSPTSLA